MPKLTLEQYFKQEAERVGAPIQKLGKGYFPNSLIERYVTFYCPQDSDMSTGQVGGIRYDEHYNTTEITHGAGYRQRICKACRWFVHPEMNRLENRLKDLMQ